jgi:hypothetical protein
VEAFDGMGQLLPLTAFNIVIIFFTLSNYELEMALAFTFPGKFYTEDR